MLDTSLLAAVATQLMSGDQVEVEGQRLRVRRTSSGRFRTVNFVMAGHEFAAIEQNPASPASGGDSPDQAARSSSLKIVPATGLSRSRWTARLRNTAPRRNRVSTPLEVTTF